MRIFDIFVFLGYWHFCCNLGIDFRNNNIDGKYVFIKVIKWPQFSGISHWLVAKNVIIHQLQKRSWWPPVFFKFMVLMIYYWNVFVSCSYWIDANTLKQLQGILWLLHIKQSPSKSKWWNVAFVIFVCGVLMEN